MYIPEISGTSCGFVNPLLTESERESSCRYDYMVDTMKCLYSREFKPLYLEGECPCVTCYEPAIWNKMIQQSAMLNKKVLWNDIIKRWEPTTFDQDFTETVDDVSSYEFRSYKSVYNFGLDSYDNGCVRCPPVEEYPRGMGYIKINEGYNVTEEKDNCCICNGLAESLSVQDYVDTIFPCGDHMWVMYEYENEGTENLVVKFMDTLDPTQTFECKFYE